MAIKNQSFFFSQLLLSLMFTFASSQLTNSSTTVASGQWLLLHPSIGISAMHVQVLKNNKLIIFDRTDFGPSNISLTDHVCRTNDEVLKPDCTAHSVLYDISSNTFRPLEVETDTWCSSGAVDANGTLVQTGGYRGGEHVIRTFSPCDDDSCDWVETTQRLADRRWYASNQILPDGRIIVVGGRISFSYEFYPKNSFNNSKSHYLRFLVQTRDPFEENNLYPFLHLLPDGNLFIFANRRSILLDYNNHRILKEYPLMPGFDKRNYPSTGSSVLLPIRLRISNGTGLQLPEAEVLVCGGAPTGSYNSSDTMRIYLEASRSCGRLKVSDLDPKWVMEQMPMPRVMPDMILLPTGDVIIINGAMNGTAGWEDAVNPALNPVLYMPNEDPIRRFEVLNPTTTPRMYHSTATLLPDGRILVGGSNPHVRYNFTTNLYPTDLSLEAFYPHYLSDEYALLRPSILSADPIVAYNGSFSITFMLTSYSPDREIFVALISPSFATHSFGMNQRMVVLVVDSFIQLSMYAFKVDVYGPTNGNVAPAGYYMMFVVNAGIPSHAVWVKVG